MRNDLSSRPDVARLAAQQCGVLARRQLNLVGIDWDRVETQVVAGRWRVRTPRVVTVTTGSLTVAQQRWTAVLHAGPRAVLGGLTAAAHRGLVGWERDVVTVLVDDELAFEPVDGVRFFRSRRPFELLQDPRPGIPCCRLEPALLLWAGYDAPVRAAHGVLAAAVQQRLTTPSRMLETIDLLKPLRRARDFRRTMGDIAGGVRSGAEADVARLCRDHDLAQPARQVSRLDADGRRRWTDCEWTLLDGRTLVLEVDGSFHMEVVEWTNGLKRARKLTTAQRQVVACSAFEVRHESAEVAADLKNLGVPSAGVDPPSGRDRSHRRLSPRQVVCPSTAYGPV